MSQNAAFEILGPRLGLSPKSRAAYVAIDLGKRQPVEREQQILAEWLGGYPEETEENGPVGGAGLSDLVSALKDQTTAITQLMERLDSLLGEASQERDRRLVNAIAAAVDAVVHTTPPETAPAGRPPLG